ncbi:MAG: HAMP domain-containing histidine kinase [Roseburia sp.]|nr:HAMP domain-containing histidine kinase [Roseburia sp.]
MEGVLFSIVILTAVALMILAGRLIRYRSQIKHMKEELSMLRQEDTNYRLSSYCRIGETEEVIRLFNEILEKYRRETAELKRENRTYRESITSISHDIRTPLTSAKGYLQMLSGEDVPREKQQEYRKTVEHRVDDVTGMLNQLFEYARVEAGELEFMLERINMTNLFADTISMFYEDFLKKDCEPEIEFSETPCYVKADRQALRRVMENLIKNALVHGTGDYKFSLRKQGDKVRLAVSNRTDSIEPKDMERIFERFYTTDTSRTRKTTGLGLAIVKQFVTRMEGEVQAALTDGIFTVEIVFPCLEEK